MDAMKFFAVILASALLLVPSVFAQTQATPVQVTQDRAPHDQATRDQDTHAGAARTFTMSDAEKAEVAARVRTETLHAWDGYKQYAWDTTPSSRFRSSPSTGTVPATRC